VLDCADILISLLPSYTRAILEGKKTVELRRRRVHAAVGTRVWLYSKTPTARIEGVARIQHVHEGGLRGIWSEYSSQVGVSKKEFEDYFKGCHKGCAIVLVEARAIFPAVDLKTIRSRLGAFHPPQFFKRLSSTEVAALNDKLALTNERKRDARLQRPEKIRTSSGVPGCTPADHKRNNAVV